MVHGRVAQRYAEALLEASVEAGAADAVAADMESLKRTVAASRELRLLLKSPVIKHESKSAALRAIFDGKVSATTIAFLDLVTEKGREPALEQMIAWFEQLNDRRRGIVKVRVSSGSELSNDQQKTIRERFAGITGKTVEMHVDVDAALRGGFRAQVGDTVFDGTVQHQLEQMHRRLLEQESRN